MLTCKNITLKYGEKTVLDGITLTIEKGLYCILGQNGAGKSSLVRILSGQITKHTGSVFINEKDIGNMSISELSRVCVFMNQSYDVSFDFTVEEVIKMGFYGLKPDGTILQKATEITDTHKFLTRKYQTLSGGEKQRVQFARAICRLYATKASILFLDEPSSSADIKQELNIIRIAKKLAQEGCGVVMISHNVSLAAEYADALILIKHGKIHERKIVSPQEIAECFEMDKETAEILLG